jgi:glycosyltransferase involved in cell wall biosynthesis
MPLFSIGVTTYNRVGLLIQTLNSIISQTFGDFEVIVANDNPNRTVSANLLGIHDPRIRFVNNPKNLGELDNMNSLLALSRGRYFTWIADDDLYAPEFLQRSYEALQKFDYPLCVFTSFSLMYDDRVDDKSKVHSGETRLYTGREFLRNYLQRRLRTMGVMGLYDREYLTTQGGLADVSADGMGFYCEYLLLVNAGLLDRVAFIDAPLCFYRIHEKSWSCALNLNTDQYYRAGVNLAHRSIERFQQPELIADFDADLTALLKWFFGEYIVSARRSESYSWRHLASFLLKANEHITPLKNKRLYWRARISLIRAQVWLVWALLKQKLLAVAPGPVKRVFYASRAFLRREQMDTHPAKI